MYSEDTIIRDTIYFTTVFICRAWYLRKDRANQNNRIFETLYKVINKIRTGGVKNNTTHIAYPIQHTTSPNASESPEHRGDVGELSTPLS